MKKMETFTPKTPHVTPFFPQKSSIPSAQSTSSTTINTPPFQSQPSKSDNAPSKSENIQIPETLKRVPPKNAGKQNHLVSETATLTQTLALYEQLLTDTKDDSEYDSILNQINVKKRRIGENEKELMRLQAAAKRQQKAVKKKMSQAIEEGVYVMRAGPGRPRILTEVPNLQKRIIPVTVCKVGVVTSPKTEDHRGGCGVCILLILARF